MEDLGADGKIILILVLQKSVMRVQSRLIWLRREKRGRML